MTELDYSRQICLPEVGEEGQRKLREAKVLVVGAGGTGSPAIMYLASAGVGRVDVADPDVVDPSNLHRQIIHKSVGEPKANSASQWVRARGAWCEYSTQRVEDVRKFSHRGVRVQYDVILDCTDRWSAHRDIITSAVRAGKYVVHGSVGGLIGRAVGFGPGSPCWLCLHPESPSGVSDVPRGTLGPVCGIIGSAMAMEAVRVLLGMKPALLGRMLAFDAGSLSFANFELTKSDDCPGCSPGGQARPSTPSVLPKDETPPSDT